MSNRPFVYLACPYSDPNPNVRELRFHAANRAAAKLMSQGTKVFSPISHTHPIAIDGELPSGWNFWERYDKAILSVCHKVYVLKLDGWEQSVGVQSEIGIANEMAIPIEYIAQD